jgi:hypothetical protein
MNTGTGRNGKDIVNHSIHRPFFVHCLGRGNWIKMKKSQGICLSHTYSLLYAQEFLTVLTVYGYIGDGLIRPLFFVSKTTENAKWKSKEDIVVIKHKCVSRSLEYFGRCESHWFMECCSHHRLASPMYPHSLEKKGGE